MCKNVTLISYIFNCCFGCFFFSIAADKKCTKIDDVTLQLFAVALRKVDTRGIALNPIFSCYGFKGKSEWCCRNQIWDDHGMKFQAEERQREVDCIGFGIAWYGLTWLYIDSYMALVHKGEKEKNARCKIHCLYAKLCKISFGRVQNFFISLNK